MMSTLNLVKIDPFYEIPTPPPNKKSKKKVSKA